MTVKEWVEDCMKYRRGYFYIMPLLCLGSLMMGITSYTMSPESAATCAVVIIGVGGYIPWYISNVTLSRITFPPRAWLRHVGVRELRLPFRHRALNETRLHLLSPLAGLGLIGLACMTYAALNDAAGLILLLAGGFLLLVSLTLLNAVRPEDLHILLDRDRIEVLGDDPRPRRMYFRDLARAEFEVYHTGDVGLQCRLELTPADPELDRLFIPWISVNSIFWPAVMDELSRRAPQVELGPVAQEVRQGYVLTYVTPTWWRRFKRLWDRYLHRRSG